MTMTVACDRCGALLEEIRVPVGTRVKQQVISDLLNAHACPKENDE